MSTRTLRTLCCFLCLALAPCSGFLAQEGGDHDRDRDRGGAGGLEAGEGPGTRAVQEAPERRNIRDITSMGQGANRDCSPQCTPVRARGALVGQPIGHPGDRFTQRAAEKDGCHLRRSQARNPGQLQGVPEGSE